jgi:hypothetical protein
MGDVAWTSCSPVVAPWDRAHCHRIPRHSATLKRLCSVHIFDRLPRNREGAQPRGGTSIVITATLLCGNGECAFLHRKGQPLGRAGMVIASYLSHPRGTTFARLVEAVAYLCKGEVPSTL